MRNSDISPQQAKAELARRELARRNLLDFNDYVYEDYKKNWHIELLCDALERILRGEIRFLIIEIPPRHSKSLNLSQLFPAFAVGKDPDATVIVSSYSGDLATDHGRETRNLVESYKYQNIFDTRLAPDSTAKGKWNTQKKERGEWVDAKGTYHAVGVGGSITGRGAKYFIVDDPFKDRKEADSENIREDRWKWLRSVARTRLTPDGAMIVNHTRWHDDDIIGRLTDKEETKEDWVDYFDFIGGKKAKWVRLTLPGIAEEDEKYRKKGEALWEDQYSLEELLDIKESIGQYEFSALYQQKPIDTENQEIKQSWFKYRTNEQVELMSTVNYLTIDTAVSQRDSADNTGIVRNYVDKEGFWNVKAYGLKINPTELIDLLFTLHQEDKYAKIGIEETVYLLTIKPFLDQEMRKRGVFLPIVPLKHNQTQKETRIRSLIPMYQSGSIVHIEKYCKELEAEATRFPKGVHDDILDSLAYQSQIVKKQRRDEQQLTDDELAQLTNLY